MPPRGSRRLLLERPQPPGVDAAPVLRGQRSRATAMEATCIEEDRARWAERKRKDIVALDVISDALEELPEAAEFAT